MTYEGSRNDTSGRAAGASRRKASDERRRSPMITTARSNRGGSDTSSIRQQAGGRSGWELRLGALQAVVWVGLALGAMVGAYFVGFFSGRYVGFDTARSVSAVEVAKLTIPTDLVEQPGEGVSDIYSRLNAPAGDSVGRAAEAQASGSTPTKGAKVPESNAARIAQEIRSGASSEKAPAKGEKDSVSKSESKSSTKPTEGSIAASEIDSLFDDDVRKAPTEQVASADQLPSDEIDAPALQQKGVRVLGGDRPSDFDESVSTASTVPTDNSLGAILEERVARAREGQVPSAGAKADVVKVSPSEIQGKPPGKNVIESPADIEKGPVGKGSPTMAEAKSSTTSKATTTLPKLPPTEVLPPEVPKRDSASTDTSFVKQVLPQGFFAQVAAPKRIAEAQDVARRLKKSGFPVVIETAHVRGEDYFRVLVGPEENKVQADRLVDQLKRESYLSGSAFLRRVN
jgi:cell division septation protein DedD